MTYPPPTGPDDDTGPSLRKEPSGTDHDQAPPTEQFGQDPYAQNPYPPTPDPYTQGGHGQGGYAQGPYGQGPYNQPAPGYGATQFGGPYGMPIVRQTNGKAIGSLVCGIAGIFTCLLFIGIPAVILGNMALSEIDGSQGTQDGRGMAVAGRVLGWVSIAIMIVGLVGLLILLISASSST